MECCFNDVHPWLVELEIFGVIKLGYDEATVFNFIADKNVDATWIFPAHFAFKANACTRKSSPAVAVLFGVNDNSGC
tara:strand:+ start:1071 stop:1301 length:231 start_codon:yes stop_codon:yes gene_type:complete